MERETAKFDGKTIHYDYHLSTALPIVGIAKTYERVQDQVWFDLHADVEFGIVLSGRMRRWWGDTQREIGPGDVWFCGVFERHGYRVVEPPCQVVALIITPDLVADLFFPEAAGINWLGLFTAPEAQRPRTTQALRPAVLDVGKRLWRCCAEPSTYEPSLQRRLMLIEALHLLADKTGDPRPVVVRAADTYARIAPAIDLALHARHLITNEQGAAACNLSRDQFIRKFKRMLGLSFTDFSLRHRMQGAHHDLSYTDRPVKAVAKDWGFTDHSHLHRVFLREYGYGPRAIRMQQRPKDKP
ncbi:MAG: AraC family transcriptional regulator [Lentisphaerae bacterium]|nr:AraC family transcriptional regulator [Lentisphaerota bacterium]